MEGASLKCKTTLRNPVLFVDIGESPGFVSQKTEGGKYDRKIGTEKQQSFVYETKVFMDFIRYKK